MKAKRREKYIRVGVCCASIAWPRGGRSQQRVVIAKEASATYLSSEVLRAAASGGTGAGARYLMASKYKPRRRAVHTEARRINSQAFDYGYL